MGTNQMYDKNVQGTTQERMGAYSRSGSTVINSGSNCVQDTKHYSSLQFFDTWE